MIVAGHQIKEVPTGRWSSSGSRCWTVPRLLAPPRQSAFVPVLTCRASCCWTVCIFAWFILHVQPWNEFHHNRDLIKHNFIIFLVAVPKVSDIVALTEFCYMLSLKNDGKSVCGLMVPLDWTITGLIHGIWMSKQSQTGWENWRSSPGSFLKQSREESKVQTWDMKQSTESN